MKNRRNKYQLSRENLNKRLEDAQKENFKLLGDKWALIKQTDELTKSKEQLAKDYKNTMQMVRLNSLIMLLLMEFPNVCNKVENSWGVKRAIGTCLSEIAQEVSEFPGDYSPLEEEDEEIDLGNFNENS